MPNVGEKIDNFKVTSGKISICTGQSDSSHRTNKRNCITPTSLQTGREERILESFEDTATDR